MITAFNKIRSIHFVLMVVLLCHFASNVSLGFGLNHVVIIVFKIILYLTGVVLFFGSIKPFKKIALYYLFYPITPVILIVFYFVHGIFFGLLSSFMLAPLMPVKAEYNQGDIKVYEKFNGFLGACCEYYVTEKSLYIFEKNSGEIRKEGGIDFDKSKVEIRNDSVIIYGDSVYSIEMK